MMTRGDDILLQTIYYPFLMYTQRRDGIALQPVVKGPGYESASYGYVNNIDTSAIMGDGLLHVFLVNRSIRETAEIEIDHGRGNLVSIISAEIVSGSSLDLCNTYENPYAISSQPLQTVKISEGKANAQLPPFSVAAITLRTA
jgi:alpha-N-arabinofuranosidase